MTEYTGFLGLGGGLPQIPNGYASNRGFDQLVWWAERLRACVCVCVLWGAAVSSAS